MMSQCHPVLEEIVVRTSENALGRRKDPSFSRLQGRRQQYELSNFLVRVSRKFSVIVSSCFEV